MKIEIESTTKIVELRPPGVRSDGAVKARIWVGKTETGVPIHCYVTRIAVQKDEDTSQFEKELQEHKPPTAEIEAIPLRLIID